MTAVTAPLYVALGDFLSKAIDDDLYSLCRNRVLTGPFAGMYMERDTRWEDGNNGLKILGYYEHELHETIAKSIIRWPDTVINIGCAGGYYAVGYARRLPNANIFAADIDTTALNMTAACAEKNNVRNRLTTFLGASNPKDILLGAGKTLYFLDCEGWEETLLDPEKAPPLANADIIVECHDFVHEKIRETLCKRFETTHDIDLINQRLPDYNLFQFLHGEGLFIKTMVLTEKRPIQTNWAAFWAKDDKRVRFT